ncbi:MAG: hypothetical protein ACHQ4J_09460 [Candidatus Binatia bacterium]
MILIKDSRSGEPIGIELLAYRPGDDRFDSVHVDVGGLKRDVQARCGPHGTAGVSGDLRDLEMGLGGEVWADGGCKPRVSEL